MLQRDVHTGGKEGTYPGTRASATMIGTMKPTGALSRWRFSICRLPLDGHAFTAVGCVPQRQLGALGVEKSEANAQATNAVIPPARCLITDLAISFGDPQLAAFHPASH